MKVTPQKEITKMKGNIIKRWT